MSNEVAKAPPVTAVKSQQTLKQLMLSPNIQAQIATALPKHLTVDRFARVSLTAMLKTPKLMQCDTSSFMQCILSLAQMGLEPDGRLAHLIPFENRKAGRTDCQLIIDYKGYVELVMRSGTVSNIHADVVCENDEFSYDRGELKTHKIDYRKPRGKVYAVYCLCRFKDGTEKCEVMTNEEVEAIRSRSRAGQSGPWVTDWNEMAKKTVFKRLSKWLSMSPEIRDAMGVDDPEHVDAIETTTVQRIEQASATQVSRASRLLGKLNGNPVYDEPEPEVVEENPVTRFKARIAAAENQEDLEAIAGDMEFTLSDKRLTKAENEVLQLELVARLKAVG